MEQLKRIAKASGTKLNDVALAACGGALRTYLLEQGELPSSPLIAFVPVNVRPKGDPGGGNAVGAMLASMATDVADPVERLRAVAASTTEAKNQYEGLSREAIMAYSAALMAPIGLQTLGAVTGLGRRSSSSTSRSRTCRDRRRRCTSALPGWKPATPCRSSPTASD